MNNRLQDQILFIASPTSPEYVSYGGAGFYVQTPYIGSSRKEKILRGLHLRMNLPGREKWYNQKHLDKDWKLVFVVEGALTTPSYLRWLCNRVPNAQILLFYSNPISKTKNPWLRPLHMGMDPRTVADTRVVPWTFDPGDAERFGIYFYENIGRISRPEARGDFTYDAVFIGQDKGRKKQLVKLEKQLQKLGLNPYIHIVADKPMAWDPKHVYKERIPYEQVQKLMDSSRCVIDFLQKGQTGVSMRTTESITKQIKVITNTSHVKKCSYYDPSNIFIIDVDDWKRLPEFLNSPFVPVDPDLVNFLSFDSQIRRNFGI